MCASVGGQGDGRRWRAPAQHLDTSGCAVASGTHSALHVHAMVQHWGAVVALEAHMAVMCVRLSLPLADGMGAIPLALQDLCTWSVLATMVRACHEALGLWCVLAEGQG